MQHEELEAVERSKRLMAMGQMAASLAHEMRNPLGSMELFCSLLKRDLQTQPALFQLAEQIHSGIKTLDRIIANSLDFSREIRPRKQSCQHLETYLSRVLEQLKPRGEEQDVAIELYCEGAGSVTFDPHLLTQVIFNVVMNAIDACVDNRERSGQAGRIELRSSLKSSKHWLLSIIDNGSGVAEKDKESIFDPFYTTKQKGTGLGLAIVHSIIAAHQGRVWIESAAGRDSTTGSANGSVVQIELPRE